MVALITGGSSGMGLEFARQLAGRGYDLLLVSNKEDDLAKAYLRSFGKSLSFETKPYGVSVTTVCPAAIATPLYNLKDKWLRLGERVRLIHTPQWLVRRALKAMFKGRRLISPSIMNVYLPVLIASLPGPLEARIWEKLK